MAGHELATEGSVARSPRVAVVTVTYNSDRYFDAYMESLQAQTVSPDLVVLVDSGSPEPSFLQRAKAFSINARIVAESNIGVCAGNNIGWRMARSFDYVLFLNPDAFLAPNFIEAAVAYMEANPRVGMVTPSLLRYDINQRRPLETIDTTGVVRGWRGATVERDAERPAERLRRYREPNRIPWLCTAVAMGRRQALEAIVESKGVTESGERAEPAEQLFDESFFMYKDDTDVSWRVRRAGWSIMHHPGLLGYHCRGWQDRKTMSRRARLLAARNEIKMCVKNRSPFAAIGLVKYALVKFFDQ